jgi:hypothetical protein
MSKVSQIKPLNRLNQNPSAKFGVSNNDPIDMRSKTISDFLATDSKKESKESLDKKNNYSLIFNPKQRNSGSADPDKMIQR